jgi:hypothetical protein
MTRPPKSTYHIIIKLHKSTPEKPELNKSKLRQGGATTIRYHIATNHRTMNSTSPPPTPYGTMTDEYQTTYDKLKRRVGYGVSSLETLKDGDIDIRNFAMDDLKTKSMFDMSDDAASDDDDALEGDKDDDVSVKSRKSIDDESVDAESDEERNVEFTEASGYGFSQGPAAADEEDEEEESDKLENEPNDEASHQDAEDTENEPTVPNDEAPESFNNPTPSQLYIVVDSIYQSADKNTMTVKQVNRSVAQHFGMDKLDKEQKALIKERLTRLVSGEIEKKKGDVEKSKKVKVKKTVKEEEPNEPNEDSEEEENYDTSSSYEEAPTKPKRSKSKSKSKGKMAQHLRNHATALRTRQLSESRIRNEELNNVEEGPKLSEEDRQRARAIADRFDTNKEEEVIKREEERRGLILGLRRRRLEILEVKEEEKGVKEERMIELEDESSEEEEEEPAVTVKPSVMDCLMAKPVSAPVLQVKPKTANSRLALRNALRAKQVKAGNRWLAR